jgi:serine/threonine protein kinase
VRKNFVCIYCKDVHPMELSMCPVTGKTMSPAHKLSFSTLMDAYAVNKVIGEGGMGVIYDGEHKATGRKVAVKFLNPLMNQSRDAYERFTREARAATMINHQNIVRVLDIGTTPTGLPFIVMEYLTGQDLATRITACRAFPMSGSTDIVSQLLDTLAAVHAEGIVHRDLKPENIFLVEHRDIGEFIKILDFGIARLSTLEQPTTRITASGQVFGTPNYVSPEQAMGDLGVDHRSDLYSTGVILYELLTGQLPFNAPTYGRVLLEIMMLAVPDPRKYLPDIPESVREFLLTAMAKKPDERYQSASEMLRELQALDLSMIRPVELPPGRVKADPASRFDPDTRPMPGNGRLQAIRSGDPRDLAQANGGQDIIPTISKAQAQESVDLPPVQVPEDADEPDTLATIPAGHASRLPYATTLPKSDAPEQGEPEEEESGEGPEPGDA